MNDLKSSYPGYSRSKDILILFTLLAICLVTYWPLTFHVYSLKNDAIIYFLPVRYQVSQSISNGYFPFWSPYFTLGHPLHAEMQSGVWNPVVQLFSLLGPYTLYTLQIETLLYIYLCGVGMYFLLRYFSIHPLVNLLCATAYMLCGFNNDSCQFLLWISGAAFLPFVFLFYFRLLRSPNLYDTCFFSLFLWLLFSTANPGEFIITAYMLTAMLLVKTARVQKEKRLQFIKKTAGLHGIALVIFICLALPAIFSYAQFLPLAERGSGATYEAAMTNPLHPLLTIAYVAPMAIYDTTKFAITDGIERNSYFGLFTFVFFVSALLLKAKNKYFTYLKYAFLINFIFSLGELGVLRIIAYYTLPLMNTFRHPAMFRLFSTFFGILLAALYIQEMQRQPAIGKKHKQVFRALAFIMAGLGILALVNIHNIYEAIGIFINNPTKESSISLALKALKSGLDFYDLLFISLIIQLPFLILFYRFAIKNFQLRKLVYAGILNCMMHAFIFTFFTVVKKDSAKDIQALINAHTHKDYPFPSLTSSLQQNSEDGMKYFKQIGTLNMYNKKIGRVNDFITPSNLLVQREFWSNTALRDKILQYPVIYQPDTACDVSDKTAMRSPTSKKMVFLTDSAYINKINRIAGNKAAFSINHFTPNAFHLTCNTKDSAFLVLSQNRYPFWQASIDGEKTPIITTNISFMGIAVPPGKHTMHFDFKATHILIAFVINLITILLLSTFLILAIKKRRIVRQQANHPSLL